MVKVSVSMTVVELKEIARKKGIKLSGTKAQLLARLRSYKGKNKKKRSSKKNIIGPLRKGTLTHFGYKSTSSAESRHRALHKAVKSEGALSIFRKLNAIATLNKNRNPSLSRKFISDRNYVKNKYM
jgi:hypothetical protein